jgi:small-conductance mechanosensitive channel
MKRLNKKGNVNDLFFYAVIFFVLVVFIIGAFVGFSKMKPALLKSEIYTPEGEAALDKVNDVFIGFDTLLVILLIMFSIVMFISAFLIRVHPVFAIVAVISFIFVVLLSMIIANVYSQLQENEDIKEITDQYPKTSHVMDKYPYFIVVIGLIFLIILFSKMVYNDDQ